MESYQSNIITTIINIGNPGIIILKNIDQT